MSTVKVLGPVNVRMGYGRICSSRETRISRVVVVVVLFLPLATLSASDRTPNAGHVIFTSPSFNEHVLGSTSIVIGFDTRILQTTLTDQTVLVRGQNTGLHSWSLAYDSINARVVLQPDTAFGYGEHVTVTLTSGIRTTTGDSLVSFSLTFVIRASEQSSLLFLRRQQYSIPGWASSLASGDFTNDSHNDLIVGMDGYVRVLVNNGTGLLSPSWDYGVAGVGRTLAANDFDNDGNLDFASLSANGELLVFRGRGNGQFDVTMIPVPGLLFDNIASADFNNDGFPDLLAFRMSYPPDSAFVSVFMNDGQGHFPTETRYQIPGVNGAFYLACGDINNDGNIDFLASSTNTGPSGSWYLSVFVNTGSGHFVVTTPYSSANFYNLSFIRDLSLEDFGGDGFLDCGVLNIFGGVVAFNRGDGTFVTSLDSVRHMRFGGDQEWHYAVGDVTGEGIPDAVIDNVCGSLGMPDTCGFFLLANPGTDNPPSRFVPFDTTVGTAAPIAPAVILVDLDGDGKLDVVSSRGTQLSVVFNTDVTGVGESGNTARPSLQNVRTFPNPANGFVSIVYEISRSSAVSVTLFDLLGRQVRTLFNGRASSGKHTITWDCRNDRGLDMGTGIYFCRVGTGSGTLSAKVLLLR